jgi:hypothetical protein
MQGYELTKQAFGSVGISQGVGINVAVIQDAGPGRWKIWGHGRHDAADGLRLLIEGVTIAAIAGGAGHTIPFGPFIVDINNKTDDIIIELNVATGGAGAASATVYAQRLSPL